MLTRDPEFDRPDKPFQFETDLDSDAASSCLVWGTIAIFCWWVPLLGQLAVAAGLIRGFQGWSSTNRHQARLGIVLSIIALILMLVIFGWVIKASSEAANS